MYIHPITIDKNIFFSQKNDEQYIFSDTFNVIKQLTDINNTETNFPQIVNIHPFETFDYFDGLKTLAEEFGNSGFKCRLNTKSIFFTDMDETIEKVRILKDIGIDEIVLRLDQDLIETIPFENILNYHVACRKNNMYPIMFFQIEDKFSERAYELLRYIEKNTFYTQSGYRKKKIIIKSTFKEKIPIKPKDLILYRVFVDDEGQVLLKSISNLKNEQMEINLGNLNESSLQQLVDINRIFYIQQEVHLHV